MSSMPKRLMISADKRAFRFVGSTNSEKRMNSPFYIPPPYPFPEKWDVYLQAPGPSPWMTLHQVPKQPIQETVREEPIQAETDAQYKVCETDNDDE